MNDDGRPRFLAKSQGGGFHIICGRVRDGQGVSYDSESDGRAHLVANGWTEVLYAVSREWDDEREAWKIVWDDQSVSFNKDGSSAFTRFVNGRLV